ncbi:DNA internalization-related competence protein ComEC/Rec2 [Lysobacter solisilvae (ex Woo and Kim 2020)]|uniref:DNA internalization-related competence protein ComEC/Rec2 n=1 Tax=Agrilutibacter terrestris TaxID=2865112 RepID=A0A7H0FY18_9GAMM|nr:DNA internalization-related competence protein ComEC/Rec2 [Lysobacter terrestris]QNP40934.1 DNA internalization-related competence protein ComEC/Rec2 [Lysobacter terrestris]
MSHVARTPPRSSPFAVSIALALLAGVVTCLWLPVLAPWGLSLVSLLAGVLAWAKPVQVASSAAMLRPWLLRHFGVFLCGLGLAGLHGAHALAVQLPAAFEKHEAVVHGVIVDLPQHDVRRTRFLFRVDADGSTLPVLRGRTLRLAWYDEERWERAPRPGAITANPPRPRHALKAGERWSLPVRLRAPRGLRNPGAADAEKYAVARRLAATGYVYAPGMARRLTVGTGIEAWREAMSARIAASVTAPSARFVQALALGDTRALDDRDWSVLRANGLTHLIAISGFHVGLVAGFFALLARGVWWLWPALARRWPATIAAALAAVLGALAYAAVAGFALPTLRTVLMIAVVAAAQAWRRPASAAQALALAAIAVILCDPLSVLGAGFWLSFLGVAWLLWCLPQGGHAVRQFLSAQRVATLGLLPPSAMLFGQASLAGPVANLIAVPWWSLVVVPLALIGLLLESLHAGAGAWAWRGAAWCFDLCWPLFERLEASGLALWWLPEARWFALPLALLGAFWLLLPRGTPGKWLALLLWLPLLWPDRRLPVHGEAELLAIDVGQGLSVLVRTRGHALLYDMGPAVHDGFDAGERAVVPALHALGVRRIDRAVISHGDNDHAGGFDAVRAEFPVDATQAPEGVGLPVATTACRAGQRWTWDGVEFEFLHPPPHFPYLANESSCVLRIRSAHGSVLLTGDIGEVIERDLARLYPHALRSDVVLVAHHGSAGSSDAAFVDATRPHFALVSSGHGNRFGHPKPEVLQRWRHAGARTFDTASGGALRLQLRAGGLRLETRRGAQPRWWDAARRP